MASSTPLAQSTNCLLTFRGECCHVFGIEDPRGAECHFTGNIQGMQSLGVERCRRVSLSRKRLLLTCFPEKRDIMRIV